MGNQAVSHVVAPVMNNTAWYATTPTQASASTSMNRQRRRGDNPYRISGLIIAGVLYHRKGNQDDMQKSARCITDGGKGGIYAV